MGRSSASLEGEKGAPARDAASKLARQRLSVLELAAGLGNAAEACRRRGMDRTSFYEWERRFQTHGFAGLKDLPPIHRSHPQATPPETVERIRALALEHPAYGCNRLEALLTLGGRRVSAITVQKILNDHGLGSRHDRWLALGKANAETAIELSAEQVASLEKLNPAFRERHVESQARREDSSAPAPSSSGPSRASARSTCTRWSTPTASYAFGFLHVSKQPEAAVAVLHNDVLPFYRRLVDLPVGAVLTDNGREFCGAETHPHALYLALNGIEHRKTRIRTPRTNGFVERFDGTVLGEFFRVRMRETFHDGVEALLQADLDLWLVHYNTERPHLGYRNQGRRPIETIDSFVSQET